MDLEGSDAMEGDAMDTADVDACFTVNDHVGYVHPRERAFTIVSQAHCELELELLVVVAEVGKKTFPLVFLPSEFVRRQSGTKSSYEVQNKPLIFSNALRVVLLPGFAQSSTVCDDQNKHQLIPSFNRAFYM